MAAAAPIPSRPAALPAPARLIVTVGIAAALHVGKLPPVIPVLTRELGLTLVQAGFLLSMIQVAGMAAGALFGQLADRLGPRRVMMAGLLLLASGSALGALADGGALAVRLAPGPQTVSTTVGWVQQLSSLGQFVGPPLVAWLASRLGGWHGTWSVNVACCGVGAALAVALQRRIALHDSPPQRKEGR